MSLKQPAKYPVKYYSHLDADAPQLADADGVIKTILKACLVTGYGAKEGAGWESLFEDDFRIVLRRPLRTGNPPDIKIENGVINGTASHRIVSQDNPTGLDDAVELAVTKLLARDNTNGVAWHLIVTDFSFMLCYQMAENGYNGTKGNFLYCGSAQKISDNQADIFVTTEDGKIAANGTVGLYANSFLSKNFILRNMRNAATSTKKDVLTIKKSEIFFNNDYVAQKIIAMDSIVLPFLCSLTDQYTDSVIETVSIDGRPMLRYLNKLFSDNDLRVLYIPLDYWEL